MGKLYVALALWLGTITTAHAQGPGLWGARSAALGQIGSVLADDGWAGAGNAAALGQLSPAHGGRGGRKPLPAARPQYRFAGGGRAHRLPRNAAAAAPVAGVAAAVAGADAPRYGTVGFTAQRFGGKLYAEQRLGLGYGYQLGTVRVGARVEVLQTSIQGLGSRRTVAASLGRAGRY